MTTTPQNRPEVMILEDEPLIALDFQETIEGNGLNVMGPYSTPNEALEELNLHVPDLALLDFNLGMGETSELVAEFLHSKGVPFAMVTGNQEASVSRIISKYQCPCVLKPADPYVISTLVEALRNRLPFPLRSASA